MGASFVSEGCREVRTNSGESILDRWLRKSGFHGATPTPEGVVAVVDMLRARPRRRDAAFEAIVNVNCNGNGSRKEISED